MGEFGKGPELQARQHRRAARGNLDRKPIPGEVAAEHDNCALGGQVIPDQMTWVSAIGGYTKAALDVSLPLACTWHKTKALLGSGLGPFFAASAGDIAEIIFVMGVGGDATLKGAMHYHERVVV